MNRDTIRDTIERLTRQSSGGVADESRIDDLEYLLFEDGN